MRPLLVVLAFLLAFADAVRADVSFHTLVLRGRTLAADGSPIVGARVLARGSVSASSMSDGMGRWSITAPLGAPAALAREPFTVEVRAEANGRRLPLASGGTALALEVSLVQRNGRAIVRARSNQPSAAAAVATAFAQGGGVGAWVEADFGGASRAGGNELRAVEEAEVPELVPPAGTRTAGPPPARGAAPRSVVTPAAPRASTPSPSSAPRADGSRRADSAAAARRAVDRDARRRADSLAAVLRLGEAASRRHADSVLAARRVATRASAKRADSLAAARAAIRTQDSLAWVAARVRRAADRERERAAQQARIDSIARWRREQRRADSLEWVARHATPAPPAPAGSRAPAHVSMPAPVEAFDSLRTAPLESSPAATASAVYGERVRRIEPFAPAPATRIAADTCACRLRGTVEVAWTDRPLEQRIPVTVTLTGPVTATRRVELFMGPPREFHFGPMPCGDYRVLVKTSSRLRYGLVTGDRDLVMRCEGSGQVRLVLEPQKR